MSTPRVALIPLYYRQPSYVHDCIRSLLAQDYPRCEIVFADNDSQDGVAARVKKIYPSVNLECMKENGGYARSYNILMHAYFKKGFDFCLLINVDTKADPQLVSSLVETYQSKKKEGIKVGLIQPIITLMKDPTKLNTMGNAVHISGIGYCPDLGKPLNIAPHRDIPISSVSGCCLLVPKDYFGCVGGFDERYFMYLEDQEYSWRGALSGYTHLLCANTQIQHDYHPSLSPRKFMCVFQSWRYFVKDYTPLSIRFLFWWVFLGMYIVLYFRGYTISSIGSHTIPHVVIRPRRLGFLEYLGRVTLSLPINSYRRSHATQ